VLLALAADYFVTPALMTLVHGRREHQDETSEEPEEVAA
jgi:hypothetical protein